LVIRIYLEFRIWDLGFLRLDLGIKLIESPSWVIVLPMNTRPFVIQLVIVGGFLVFLYILFAFTTSMYKDYKLDLNISDFQAEIDELAEKARQKPLNVAFYESLQYKDRYAKENLNLLNPGEHLIIIPTEERIVKTEKIELDKTNIEALLKLPIRHQWWEYFFGQTLSVTGPKPITPSTPIIEPTTEPETGAPAEG